MLFLLCILEWHIRSHPHTAVFKLASSTSMDYCYACQFIIFMLIVLREASHNREPLKLENICYYHLTTYIYIYRHFLFSAYQTPGNNYVCNKEYMPNNKHPCTYIGNFPITNQLIYTQLARRIMNDQVVAEHSLERVMGGQQFYLQIYQVPVNWILTHKLGRKYS